MTGLRIGMPLAACLALFAAVPAQAQQANVSFFVTSVGPGKGADLGGLAGADKHCQGAPGPRLGTPICSRKAPAR